MRFISYPFGMLLPGRKYSAGSIYRYGFNGQEKSDEIGEGLMSAQYWEYDSRIGRRWNVDPVTKLWESPYACFNNNPISIIDPNGTDGTPYKVKKGDNLSKIAKKFGTTVERLLEINDIKNPNKIQAGRVIELYALPTPKAGQEMTQMLGNPELDFKSNPLTGYNNINNDKYAFSVNTSTKQLGYQFITNEGRISILQNTVIAGGKLLDEVQNLPSVTNLINTGLKQLYADKKFEPGEYYKSSYTMSSITGPDGQRIFKQAFSDLFTKKISNNYFFSAENFLGSYGFSMRVSGNGKEMVICVYDSKTLGSLADHRKWLEKSLPDLAPIYQRYLWNIPIKENK